VAELYAEDGEMYVNGRFERRGRETIRAHYASWMVSFAPGDIATEIGQFIVDGGEVVTEIATTHAGRRSSIAEVFSTQGGLITKLSCYIDNSTLPPVMVRTP
jgi:SnoaL-like domain